ncbi:RHS repeat-associated core domain-containing protein [Streptomyces griseosporeus]|uniref:RHS repeat-associated core domain-containing protein n=1 Tax=Streptomyces griseosporeus TaxID=1910 RepID=UPI0036FE9884
MGYTIPGWLDEILDFIGINFPNVDEDDFREMATSMREFADNFEGKGGDAHQAVTRILSSSQGWAVDAMEKHWSHVKAGHLDKIPELARLFADACDVVADIVYGMKIKAEIELGAMAASVGISLGLAAFTGGLSALLGAAEITAMRQAVKRIVDEAADRIVDELVARVTEPVNAKLEKMVEDAVLDLAEGAFSLPPAPDAGGGDGGGGGGGKHGHGGGMQLASAGGGSMVLASAGGGPGGGVDLFIDHVEFEDGADKVSRHGGDLHTAVTAPLERAKGHFGRTKGKDAFTAPFESVLEGALKGSEKAVKKVVKHLAETVPDRVKATSRLHKGNDIDAGRRANNVHVNSDKKGDGSAGHHGVPASGRKPDPAVKVDSTDLSKQARELNNRPLCNDPIDIASGQMIMAQTDADLPAVLPLTLRRTHLSGYDRGRFFGPSWASTLDERLEENRELGGVWWYREDGSILVYPRRPDLPGDRVDPAEGVPLPLTYVTRGTTYVLTTQDPRTGLMRHFEPSPICEGVWWLSGIEDRNGNTITVERADDDTPAEVTHTGGYHLRLDTDPEHGRVTALHLLTEDGPVRLRAFRYDDAGDLTESRNAVDAPLHLTYDAAHRITAWRDSNDTVFTYTYDDRGRVTATHGSEGFLDCRIEYGVPEPDGTSITAYTDSLGHITVYRANHRGQIIAITDPLGETTTQTWDRHDRLLSRTSPLGHTVRHSYDEAGNLVATEHEDGTRSTTDFDAHDRPSTITLADGSALRQEYDARGNLTRVTEADGSSTHYAYDPTGAVATVTDALGHVTTVRNNAAGLPVEVTDPLGATTAYTRDAFGNLSALTDPLGATSTLEWSAAGKPLRLTLPDGGTETWEWDGEGNCVRHTDAAGNDTRFEFTHFDVLTARTGPDGARYLFTHDTERRLTQVTAPQGLTWSYEYDAAGHLVAETDFDDRRVRYGVDADGRLTSRTGAAGEVIRYERDKRGRTVRKDAAGAITSFAYSPIGELVRATGPDAELTLDWDAAGRLTAETVDGRTTRYTYDALGRRLTRTTPSGASSAWTYDAAGNPVELNSNGRVLTFTYDPAGRELTRTLSDALSLSSAYDPLGRLTRQELNGPASGRVLDRGYSYRADGLLTGIHDSRSGARRFDLDRAGRVTAVRAGNWSETYAYDVAGNQVAATWPSRMPGGEATGERAYSGTRVHTAGQVRYAYDAEGRITVRSRTRLSRKPEAWHYTWDAEHRLTTVTTPDGVTWRYRYDPLGRRIAKQRLGADGRTVTEQTDFVWDGTTLAEQTTHTPGSGSGSPRLTLTWEHRMLRPVCQTERKHLDDAETDSRFFAIVTDLVGAPTELVGEDGGIAWHTRATLWGATAWNRDADAYTPLRFPGQYADPETRLHYNFFRHYDPETARYVSPDPLGLGPAPNPVAYVHNPLQWADPLGLAAEHNPVFPTRREAFNHARDMAGVPNSAQPIRQWEIGGDAEQARRHGNYVYRPYDPNGDPKRDPRPGWGRYYQYDTPHGSRVIAEHTSDPNAPHPHFHAGKPQEGLPPDVNMMGKTYKQIMPKHHIYYEQGRCNGK